MARSPGVGTKWRARPLTHASLARAQVRWLLLVAGGYECQEAEGTFMVAFASADAAIEWCLMVQRVLRDMNWPERWAAARGARRGAGRVGRGGAPRRGVPA